MVFNRFSKITLGDIAFVTKLAGFEYTKYLSKNFIDSGVPVVQGRNIKNKQLNLDNIKYISKDLSDSLVRSKVNFGDILFSYVGTVGDVYFHNTNEQIHLGSNVAKISTLNNKDVLNKYIFYSLQGTDVINKIVSKTKGSVQNNINMADLRSIEINLPPYNEQKSIVTILSSIDKKIEVNNQINKALESIAQEVFKHWFVDFEFPNEEGLPYKSSGGEMIDSELGMIPKMWEVSPLRDVLVLNYGKALTAKDRVAGEIKVYSSAGNTGFHNKALVESDGIIIGRKGTIGTVYYARDKFYCIDTAYYITPEDCKFDLVWTFELLKQLKLEKLNEDSAVPGLNRNTVYSQKIVVPTSEVVAKLSNILSSITKNIFQYNDENEILSNLKDTLLPKLMSGEIDLSNIEINQ